MRRTPARRLAMLFVLCGFLLPLAPADAVPQPPVAMPLARAHAHNDYEHDRPLTDALAHGFSSVEADVWLVDGELLVAHDRDQVQPGRTLERLYLRPLRDRVRQAHGGVYPHWRNTFHLLIDVKSDADPTYAAIHRALRRYVGILTKFVGGHAIGGAVTATISGNRNLAKMSAQPIRFAGYDGRLNDLGGSERAELIPLISDNWSTVFSWRGEGPMPKAELEKLRQIVRTAHHGGQRVRFWETPDDPGAARTNVWHALLDAGIDLINTDHLADLQRFLRTNDPHPGTPPVRWWPPLNVGLAVSERTTRG